MTNLRQRMVEELQRRNYSPTTIRSYILTVKQFAEYFGKPPDRLGATHVQRFQWYLLQERKLTPVTVEMYVLDRCGRVGLRCIVIGAMCCSRRDNATTNRTSGAARIGNFGCDGRVELNSSLAFAGFQFVNGRTIPCCSDERI